MGDAVRLLCGTAFTICAAWIIQYSTYRHWWKDPIGRTFVWMTSLMALAFAGATADIKEITWDWWRPPDWLLVALLTVVNMVMLARVCLWAREYGSWLPHAYLAAVHDRLQLYRAVTVTTLRRCTQRARPGSRRSPTEDGSPSRSRPKRAGLGR